METKKRKISNVLIIITSVLLLFLTASTYLLAADEDIDFDIEEVTDIDPIAKRGNIKVPTVLDVKKSISEMEKEGVTIFTRVFNIDRSAGIQELFQKCRDVDEEVKKAGTNPTTKKLFEAYKTRKYRKAHGSARVQGKYFEIIGPKRIKRFEKGKSVKQSFLKEMKAILAAADSAFEKTTGDLRMSLFINWSKVPGRIYVVVEPENWLLVGGSSVKAEIVQTAIAKPETREFYVFAGGKVFDYADQAIKFAVAKMVYEEYAKIITGKPDAKLPFYFLTGAAAEAGGTEAIITAAGPKQVEIVRVPKAKRVKRPKKGIMLPLRAKNLYSLDELINTTINPSQVETKYYFLRQTRQLIQTLRDKAPLSYICLVRALSSGKEFNKEIGLSYMEMQRDVEGRAVKRPSKKKTKKKEKRESYWDMTHKKEEKIVDPKLKDYERFSRYLDTVFHKLTEEYMVEEWQKAKAKKAKEAKEAKEAKDGKKDKAEPKAETEPKDKSEKKSDVKKNPLETSPKTK